MLLNETIITMENYCHWKSHKFISVWNKQPSIHNFKSQLWIKSEIAQEWNKIIRNWINFISEFNFKIVCSLNIQRIISYIKSTVQIEPWIQWWHWCVFSCLSFVHCHFVLTFLSIVFCRDAKLPRLLSISSEIYLYKRETNFPS